MDDKLKKMLSLAYQHDEDLYTFDYACDGTEFNIIFDRITGNFNKLSNRIYKLEELHIRLLNYISESIDNTNALSLIRKSDNE